MSETMREATIEEYIEKMVEEEDKGRRREMASRTICLLEEQKAREYERLSRIKWRHSEKVDRMSAVIVAMAEYVNRIEARKEWDDV